jgi:hypothetical protein
MNTQSPQGWRRPHLLTYTETLRGLGGIVAPLLTGFSLATMALVLTSSTRPPQWAWSLVALSLAVVLFLYSMQLAFLALARSPAPRDFLDWVPEIATDKAELLKAQAEQRETFKQMSKLWARTGGYTTWRCSHSWRASRCSSFRIHGPPSTRRGSW